MSGCRRLAALLVAVALASAVAWFWPIDATRPLYAWFPGERRLSGAMMKAVDAAADVRLVAVHRPNLVALQANDPWFAFRLLAAGGVPLSASTGSVLCRPVDG